MADWTNRDNEREEFERWHRYGHERGWVNRTVDEIRSWFGDEDAERRRKMDEHERPMSERERMGHGYDLSPSERGRYSTSMYNRSPIYGSSNYGSTGYGSGVYGTGSSSVPYGTTYGDMGRNQPRFFENRERFGSQGLMGSFRGRGPRNYQRNDERIKEDVIERLTHHHDIDASDIDVVVQNGEVTLKGNVDQRWTKRLVEDITEDVFGVKEVHNQLRVVNRMEGGLFAEQAEEKATQRPLTTNSGTRR